MNKEIRDVWGYCDNCDSSHHEYLFNVLQCWTNIDDESFEIPQKLCPKCALRLMVNE